MATLRSFSLGLALAASLLVSRATFAAEISKGAKAPAGQLVPITEKEIAWAAKAKAEYPVTSCPVSNEKLGGDMGQPVDQIYRQEGKPDRLIRFCCKDCVKDFNENPAKYLKALDDASASKAKIAPKG
jgi:hypothetical protein